MIPIWKSFFVDYQKLTIFVFFFCLSCHMHFNINVVYTLNRFKRGIHTLKSSNLNIWITFAETNKLHDILNVYTRYYTSMDDSDSFSRSLITRICNFVNNDVWKSRKSCCLFLFTRPLQTWLHYALLIFIIFYIL